MPKQNNDFDILQRFSFERYPVRGIIIRLKATYQQAYEYTEYSANTQKFLGEALCAIGLLSSTIKYEGRLTLQAQGDGNLNLLLVQANEKLQLRGLAKEKHEVSSSFQTALNQGHLLISIDAKDAKNRYQAITEIKKDNLAEVLEHYFMQSEQLPTRLWLFADKDKAAGLLLQKIPSKNDELIFWEHITKIAETITAEELLKLTNKEILQRLFHEEDIRLYDREPIAFKCGCSTERMEIIIEQLGKKEVDGLIKEQGAITATCEFCNRTYKFDKVDIAKIFSSGTKIKYIDTKQ